MSHAIPRALDLRDENEIDLRDGVQVETSTGRQLQIDPRGPFRLDLTAWFGFFVPKETPQDIVELLHAKVRRIIDSPEVQARLVGVGVEPGSMTAAQFEQFVTAERKKYGDFLTELEIRTE